MKVVCIDDFNSSFLTTGKTYTVVKDLENLNQFLIMNDDGKETYYDKWRLRRLQK